MKATLAALLLGTVVALAQPTPKIAYTIQAGPVPGSYLNSYCAVVVTGAVTQASQTVKLEACTNLLDPQWTVIATNTLTAAHGKFWLSQPVSMSWTVFYDYDWTKRRCCFYRLTK